ncbi:MAG: sigma-70 family RNA polymerase sigma factor [Firmicutes bacterium]|nr:sigma-70 family RNA polymerase sigma factor [Bacillota bacterium]
MKDNAIIELYWNRDEAAIPATAEKYGRYCNTVAINILGNAEDAEECVNDTWLRAWEAIPPHRPSLLSAFLGKLTRNLAFNRYKQFHAQKRGGGETALVLEELEECISGKETVEQEIDRKELAKEIDNFLAGLPPETRRCFVRRYWYCDSVKNIAAAYSRTPAAVTMLLSRTRQQLKTYLDERGYFIV